MRNEHQRETLLARLLTVVGFWLLVAAFLMVAAGARMRGLTRVAAERDH
jgi:hypothetical protein